MKNAASLSTIIAEAKQIDLSSELSAAAGMAMLVERHGGRGWEPIGTYALRLGGLTVSCTAGRRLLVRAWIEKAERIVETTVLGHAQ